MRVGQLVLMLSCAAIAAAGCAEATDPGGGDGHAHYQREVRGASAHNAAVGGVSRDGAVALDRVLSSATDLAPTLGRFAAGDFTLSATTQATASDAPITFVSGRQTIGGVPIVDSHLYLAVAPAAGGGDQGTLLSSSYRLFDGADVDVTPAIGRDEAEALGRDVLRAPTGAQARDVELVIREIDGELTLVWDVRVDDVDGYAVVRAAGVRAGITDVVDDRVYETRGKVSAWVAVGGAPGAHGVAQLLAQPAVTVMAGSTLETTRDDGGFTIAAADGTMISASVVGPAAHVKSMGTPGVSASAPAASMVDLTLATATGGERDLAQTTAFHYVTATRRFLVDNGLPAASFGAPLTTNVNLGETCNAYFSPGARTINFFRAGGGCNNSAEASIIAHEYGHFVDDAFGGIRDSGLSEGWGDLIACFELQRPDVGGDLFQNHEPLRTCDNDYRFPSGGYDEPHALGQAWAGFGWHARAGLIAALGTEAGNDLARKLILPSLSSNAPDIKTAVREVFLRDDDDGNLANHTPHWDILIAAARRHGLDFVVDRDVTPPSKITDLVIEAPTSTSVTVRWTAPGDDGTMGTAAGYELRWSREPMDESTFARGTLAITPRPTAAGTAQTARLTLPPGGPVWVAMRAADELGNLGPLSNVVSATPPVERTVFQDGGENGSSGWDATGLWHVTARRAGAGTHAFWYGNEATGTYDTPGRANSGSIVSPVIDLRGVAAPRLTWLEYVDVESSTSFDVLRVEVFDVEHPELALTAAKTTTRTWAFQARLLDLTGFGERRVRIRLSFDTRDGVANATAGWFVDEIRVFGETTPPPPPAGQLVINEILADPPAGYDANGDGTASTTSDEFVELVNAGTAPLDLSGATIADATGVRRTLPAGTTIAPGKALVVFGPLGLNNDGDVLTIKSAAGTMMAMATATYGSEGGDDQSLTRATDGDGRAAFVKHRTVAATPASPGKRANGQPF